MFPDYRYTPVLIDRFIHPDQRPTPAASEIRLRVKRTLHREEA